MEEGAPFFFSFLFRKRRGTLYLEARAGIVYVVASVAETIVNGWLHREKRLLVFVMVSLLFLILYRCGCSHVVPESFLQQVPYPLLAELWQDADDDQL